MSQHDEMCILMGTEAAAFMPSKRHIGIKLRLQKYVSPAILAKLDRKSIGTLSKYVSNEMIAEIQEIARYDLGFLDWLLAEEDSEIELQMARSKAVKTLIDAMDREDEGDAKVLSIKVKAAEAILKFKNETPSQKVNNTLKIGAMPAHMRSLAGKSTEDLEEELRQMQSSS